MYFNFHGYLAKRKKKKTVKVNTLWMQSQVLKSEEHTRLLKWYVTILRTKACFFNKTDSIATVGKNLKSCVTGSWEALGIWYIPHSFAYWQRKSLFYIKTFLLASKLERISKWINVLFPFGYSTATYILSNLSGKQLQILAISIIILHSLSLALFFSVGNDERASNMQLAAH